MAFLLTQVDFSNLLRQVTGIQPGYFLLGGVLYLLKSAFRALRFQRLNSQGSGEKPAYLDMLRLVLASSLAAQLLPLKLGEFAYVYLLKRGNQASISKGLSTLLAARLFDLFAIGLLFLLVSLALGLPQLAQLSVYFNAIMVFIALLAVVIAAVLFASRWAGTIIARIYALKAVSGMEVLARLRPGLESLFGQLAAYSPRDILEWSLLAGLEWLVNYFAFHVLLMGIGLAPGFYDTVVAVTFAALTSVLPLNSFGSFGSLEAGWAAGLLLMGYPRETAVSSGFASHLLTLAYMLVLGGFSWLSYLLSTRPGKSQ